MATQNFNLPTYASGDTAEFLTMKGWNDAMQAIDTAIAQGEGGGEAGAITEQEYIYVMEIAANETSATITVPVVKTDVKRVLTFTADASSVESIQLAENAADDQKTEVTVAVATAPSAALSINVTVVKGVE